MLAEFRFDFMQQEFQKLAEKKGDNQDLPVEITKEKAMFDKLVQRSKSETEQDYT